MFCCRPTPWPPCVVPAWLASSNPRRSRLWSTICGVRAADGRRRRLPGPGGHSARLDARQSCLAQGHPVPTRAARLDARQPCPAQGYAVPTRAHHALHKGMHVSMHVSHTCARYAVPTRVARLDARQSCPAQGHAVPIRAQHALHTGMHVSMHVSHTCTRYAVPTRVARLDARQSCPAQGYAVPTRASHALHKGTMSCPESMPCHLPDAATDHFGPLRDHCRLEPIPITFGIARYESVYALVSHT